MRPLKKPPTLERKTFAVSRLAEFASAPELTKQIGHPLEHWPAVIFKEIVDNAIDAAEEKGEAPVVVVSVDEESITVQDAGPGIAPAVVKSLIDYTRRTSSRAHYVSPSRGQQGNALQSIIPMGYALAGEGETVVESRRGVRHRIAFTADPVRQIPRVEHKKESSTVKIGAWVTVGWPDRTSTSAQ